MKFKNSKFLFTAFALFLGGFTLQVFAQQGYDTEEKSMLKGVSKNIKNGWKTDPVFTVGETDNNGTDYSEDRFGYRLPGIPDGMYGFRKGFGRVNVLLNHELTADDGYPFTLANGTTLTGARVTKLELRRNFFGAPTMTSAALAHHTIYDRYYNEVTSGTQIDEGNDAGEGLRRLCSANGIERFKFGFLDDIFFTGEETGGGQEFALDVKGEVLYCAPAMGRAAWESVCVMDNFNSNKVVVLVGDDRGGAPLLLYVGQKFQSYPGDNAPMFLKRNGLAKGNLYVWVADNGDSSPEDWNGTGTTRSGKFVKIPHYNPSMAGQAGYDNVGWANQDTQDDLAFDGAGAFAFSRPEDVHTNPADGTQAVLASTGRSSLFPSDSWGTTYLVDFDDADLASQLSGSLNNIDNIVANLTVIYDGDDSGNGQFSEPAAGLRSPDNLVWAEDGYIYLNEDRSVGGFCGDFIDGNLGYEFPETSVWQLDPNSGELTRILEMDRNAVPFAQTDIDQDDCGDWESSGTIDVSKWFRSRPGETVLLLNVQAHSIRDEEGPIGGSSDLVQGGQLLFASRIVEPVGSPEGISSGNTFGDDQTSGNQAQGLRVFPNPAQDVLNLSKAASFIVVDVTGNVVLNAAEPTQYINVSSLRTGIYFLQTTEGETVKVMIK